MHEASVRRRVEFADTDMAAIMHFSAYYRYMEAAEHELFRAAGLSVHMEVDGRTVGWPRVHASCDFKAPLRFEDEFEVRVTVRSKSNRSMTCEHVFRRLGGDAATEVARGRMTLVCAQWDESGRFSSIDIPPDMDRRLAVAPLAD